MGEVIAILLILAFGVLIYVVLKPPRNMRHRRMQRNQRATNVVAGVVGLLVLVIASFATIMFPPSPLLLFGLVIATYYLLGGRI